MAEFYEMIRHTRSYNDRIRKFCAPLFRNFGFNCLFYHYISKEGYGTCFSTHIQSFEYYFHNHLYRVNPYARHPDHFQTGVHLIPEIKDQNYQKTIQLEAEEFDTVYKVVLLEKTSNGCQGFSFAVSKKNQHSIPFNFTSDLPVLQCFVRRFKEEAKEIMQRVLEDQLRLDIAIGADFYSKPIALEVAAHNQKKIEFLKQLGILQSADDIQLSNRESECIRLLLQGYAASQIAEILNLSKRTVEHYIENVKLKTNCYTKLELIEKFKEIDALGLL